MTVQFAGSRSMDERRRRRLAVAGDVAGSGSGDAEPGEEKSLPDCVPAEFCAAAPWIPRSLWKLWTLTALLFIGLATVIAMTWRTPDFRPELAPALDPLFRGDRPRLMSYLSLIFWTVSGQLALLVGWHRSHSRLDFRGRYRVWPWAAAVMFASGLCVATDLHIGLGAIVNQLDFLPQGQPQFGWLLPAMSLLLPIWLLMDRDVRRSLSSLILLRLTVVLFISSAAISVYGSEWIGREQLPLIESACGLIGPALLMTSLWVQGWYVAYVTPDPPVAGVWKWPKLPGAILGWLFRWLTWPFRRRVKVEPETPATGRRRKKAGEGTATTTRKRKPKRKPRTRTKVVEEEEADEEEMSEEEAAEAEAEEYQEEAVEEEESYEEEEERESTPSRVTAPVSRSNNSRDAAPRQNTPAPTAQSRQQDEEDEEDSEGDGEQWRIDGPPAEQLKGLSKRQRRNLIKQHRDQQRSKTER